MKVYAAITEEPNLQRVLTKNAEYNHEKRDRYDSGESFEMVCYPSELMVELLRGRTVGEDLQKKKMNLFGNLIGDIVRRRRSVYFFKNIFTFYY